MTGFRLGLLVCLGLLLAPASLRAAETPYGKTFVGSANLCLTRLGQCTGVVPIHVYLAKSGRLFSFLRSEGGQEFSLGQYVAVGDSRQRFIVNGSTLVFEDLISANGAQLVIRGYLRANRGRCSVSGSATYNGATEPSTLLASCEVYDGQR